MERAHVVAAVAISVLVALTVTIAQPHVGNDDTAKPEDEALFSTSSAEEQGRAQAEQMEDALEDLRASTKARSDELQQGLRHTLVVTIRDKAPLDVWDGGGCRLTSKYPVLPYLVVLSEDNEEIGSAELPKDARVVAGGACEAIVTVSVVSSSAYHAGLVVEGRGILEGPPPPPIKHEGTSQKVTVVD